MPPSAQSKARAQSLADGSQESLLHNPAKLLETLLQLRTEGPESSGKERQRARRRNAELGDQQVLSVVTPTGGRRGLRSGRQDKLRTTQGRKQLRLEPRQTPATSMRPPPLLPRPGVWSYRIAQGQDWGRGSCLEPGRQQHTHSPPLPSTSQPFLARQRPAGAERLWCLPGGCLAPAGRQQWGLAVGLGHHRGLQIRLAPASPSAAVRKKRSCRLWACCPHHGHAPCSQAWDGPSSLWG